MAEAIWNYANQPVRLLAYHTRIVPVRPEFFGRRRASGGQVTKD
jgi:hypothetical protein